MPRWLRYGWSAAAGTSYTADDGQLGDYITKVAVPDDMTDAEVAAMITSPHVNSSVYTTPVPCLRQVVEKPRRLVFVRSNGNRMSFAIPNRVDIESKMTNLAALITTAGAGLAVQCAYLEGEERRNLHELTTYRSAPVTFTPAAPVIGTGGKAITYYGTTLTNYSSDVSNGANVRARARVAATDPGDLTGVNAILGGVISCVGTNTQVNSPCGAASRDHRRYIATIGTTDPLREVQSISVPNSSYTATNILTCGQDLAANTNLLCLDYKGESMNMSRLLP